MVVDCHIEVAYTHTGGMPMSVRSFCLSSRRSVARLYPDGRIEYRTDPNWFTPYHRRETVEWSATQAAQAARSEEHTSELQSLMRISYAVLCLKKKIYKNCYNKRPDHSTADDRYTQGTRCRTPP